MLGDGPFYMTFRGAWVWAGAVAWLARAMPRMPHRGIALQRMVRVHIMLMVLASRHAPEFASAANDRVAAWCSNESRACGRILVSHGNAAREIIMSAD